MPSHPCRGADDCILECVKYPDARHETALATRRGGKGEKASQIEDSDEPKSLLHGRAVDDASWVWPNTGLAEWWCNARQRHR